MSRPKPPPRPPSVRAIAENALAVQALLVAGCTAACGTARPRSGSICAACMERAWRHATEVLTLIAAGAPVGRSEAAAANG